MKEDLLKIMNHYGINHQLRKFNEECFELKEAILDSEFSKKNFPKQHEIAKDVALGHITEEIADCLVMINQFVEYYNIQESDIYMIMEQKIDRQLERLNNKNNSIQ